MLRFWHAWREGWRLAQLDADKLTEEYGRAAYEVAWSLAREVESGTFVETRPERHWNRVMYVIAWRDWHSLLRRGRG